MSSSSKKWVDKIRHLIVISGFFFNTYPISIIIIHIISFKKLRGFIDYQILVLMWRRNGYFNAFLNTLLVFNGINRFFIMYFTRFYIVMCFLFNRKMRCLLFINNVLIYFFDIFNIGNPFLMIIRVSFTVKCRNKCKLNVWEIDSCNIEFKWRVNALFGSCTRLQLVILNGFNGCSLLFVSQFRRIPYNSIIIPLKQQGFRSLYKPTKISKVILQVICK